MLEGDENETFKFCLILARKMIGRRWFGVKFKKKKKNENLHGSILAQIGKSTCSTRYKSSSGISKGVNSAFSQNKFFLWISNFI